MGFILDGLETEAYDRQYGDRELVRRVAAYFRPHAWRAVAVAAAIVLNSIAGSAGPILVSRAIDAVQGRLAIGAILLIVGGVLLLGAAGWTFNYVQRRLGSLATGNVVLQLQRDVFAATIRHDLSFYDRYPTGKIVSRVTSDTEDFASVVTLVYDLLAQALLVLILGVYLFTVDAGLTLLLLAMTPVAVLIAISFRRVARTVTQQAKRVRAKINAQIQESISGIGVAKSFRQEHTIYAAFNANNRQSYRVGLRRGLTLNTIWPVMNLASGAGLAVMVYAAGLASGEGGLSPGEWYLFMQAVASFWWPLLNVASFWSQFQDGLSAAERVFALVDAEPAVVQTASEDVPALEGAISFRNLTFSYTGEEVVLPGLDLEIRPRETVALVGHTGAGKSSVARLIGRLYEFQGGDLLIDGRDIRRLDLEQYRRQVGVVPQEPFLFSGTVCENIRYPRPEADTRDVLRAAMRISGGDWLRDLPDGLDTDVGERGASVSMGQRQLIALARVLLKDPAIFVLDEATASVDPFTEAQIQQGLETVMQDRTAVIIAHRLSTVKNADRIVVVEQGRIIEEGTHESLLAQGGHYAHLYDTYFRHQSLEYVESFGDGRAEPGGGRNVRSA
jgi:ATP-binding cassette subfamily B protein